MRFLVAQASDSCRKTLRLRSVNSYEDLKTMNMPS